MVTIIQRARMYIGRREGKEEKGISLSVDTRASEGGAKMAWRFGEFVLVILLRIVLRYKTLEGGARGVGASALLNIPHITTRSGLRDLFSSCLGKGWEGGRRRMLHKQSCLDICCMLPNGKGGMTMRWRRERSTFIQRLAHFARVG